MSTRSAAVVDSTVTPEEELRLVLAEIPISDNDLDLLFGEAFEPDLPGTANTQVQRPSIENSMSLTEFLASGMDPMTSITDEAAPPTLPSTLLLRNGEGS